MIESYVSALATVTVAVSLDEHSEALVRIGARLAKRLGKQLCLLHIVEPWAELPVSQAFGKASPLWNVVQAVGEGIHERAEAAVADLAKRADVQARIVVVSGKPKDCLGPEALEIGSCLLLVGYTGRATPLLPRGLSTVLSLMATTPVPLLVIDPTTHTEFPPEELRVLLADDLGDKGDAVALLAFDLAARFGKTWVHHVHINGLTREVLDAGIACASAAAHTQLPVSASAADVHALLRAQLARCMEARFEAYATEFTSRSCRYTSEIVEGGVKSGLSEVIEAVKPHVTVFGRHRSVHDQHTALARLPARSVLNESHAVIVVPDL